MRGEEPAKWLAERLSFKHLFHGGGQKKLIFQHFCLIVFTASSVPSFIQRFPLMGFVLRSSALEGVFLEVPRMCY